MDQVKRKIFHHIDTFDILDTYEGVYTFDFSYFLNSLGFGKFISYLPKDIDMHGQLQLIANYLSFMFNYLFSMISPYLGYISMYYTTLSATILLILVVFIQSIPKTNHIYFFTFKSF